MLSTRTIWTAAGLAWGLLVGIITAVQTAAFLFGVGWLFIFGDDPWPEAANWVLLGMAALAGIIPVILLAWLGRRLGIAFENESRQRLRTRRRGWFVLALAVGGLAICFGLAAAGALTDRARRADRQAAERQYTALSGNVHRIADIQVSPAAPPDIQATIEFVGRRPGEYVLTWTLRESLYDSTLVAGNRTLTLPEAPSRETIVIDMAAVRAKYRDAVLDGRGGALVDEAFELRVALRPVLSPAEAARLPESEVHNLELGASELISVATAPLPVHFEVR